MSPLTLRRYRAERLLRQEFEALRGRVMATVRGRLGASGARLDTSDLEACYSQAWAGLYAAVLDGQEIANPTGWLTLVTFRRAIEELRGVQRGGGHGHGHSEPGARQAPPEGAEEPDFAAELDDRMRLRHLFEGLRGRLSAREREAAAFCYLQGLSRSEAASRLGISQARMGKLMDGRGAGRPGVAGKVGELADTIRAGGWCEEQGSLMRGLAYGILDPEGERYRLALIHRSECPACRAYVVSLRGLAVVLPPVLLPWGLGAGALARAGSSAHAHAGIGAHPGGGAHAGAGAGAGAGGVQAGGGVAGAMSSGVLGGGGAAGIAGAGGGSWLLAGGPLATKIAAGCLLALGVGAGCVALTEGPVQRRAPIHRREASRTSHAGAATAADLALSGARAGDELAGSARSGGGAQARSGASAGLTPAEKAAREFGPERQPALNAPRSASAGGAQSVSARQASAGESPITKVAPARSASGSGAPQSGAGTSAAEREFGIG